MRFQKPPFLWISTFDSVFENLRFCGVFVGISVNTFTKTEVFLSVFVQKRSSVNGALIALERRTLPLTQEEHQTHKNIAILLIRKVCFCLQDLTVLLAPTNP